MTTRQRFGLVAALLVAALFSDILSRAAYRRAWRALRSLVWVPKQARVSDELRDRRLAACRHCPVRHKDTCGSPFHAVPEIGCWCYLPAIAELAGNHCWIDQNFTDESDDHARYGWRKAGCA